MSNKEIVIDLVHRLPDDASLQEIAREIEFVAAVREGFEQLDRGEGRPIAEVEEMVSLCGSAAGSRSVVLGRSSDLEHI